MIEFDKDYIDLDTALARVRNNKTLFAKMLKMLLDCKEFDAFEEKLAQGEYAQASDIAHAIKGMTGNLSLNKIFKLSTDLMVQLRQGAADETTLKEYRETLEKTKADVRLLIADIEANG